MLPYPFVEVVVSVGTWDFAVEAYPDTGFEGGLSIPLGMAREIVAEAQWSAVRLADGVEREVPSWPAVLELEGRRFDVGVVAIGRGSLLGREVLDLLEICFHFGREVRLQFRD